MVTYFDGRFVPDDQAKIGVKTHAFNYGTGCFEGIRGYWNEQSEQIYLFRLREHYERLVMPDVPSPLSPVLLAAAVPSVACIVKAIREVASA